MESFPLISMMNVVGNKWISWVKYHLDGSVQCYKDCLIAKGFQQNLRLDYTETFSPTVKPFTIQVIFTLTITNNWDI